MNIDMDIIVPIAFIVGSFLAYSVILEAWWRRRGKRKSAEKHPVDSRGGCKASKGDDGIQSAPADRLCGENRLQKNYLSSVAGYAFCRRWRLGELEWRGRSGHE